MLIGLMILSVFVTLMFIIIIALRGQQDELVTDFNDIKEKVRHLMIGYENKNNV